MTASVITGPVFKSHDRAGHHECHARLLSIEAALPQGIRVHEPVAAAAGDLTRIHKRGYLDWLDHMCNQNAGFCFLDDYTTTGGYMEQNQFVAGYIDPNTYINPCSYEVATYAAGSAVAAAGHALSGETCFALVRPPGHHADSDNAMGFCLLNNVAVAAGFALTAVDRVAIVDWDAHHGNGTQNIFYKNDRVLFCSIHEEDAFPHTGMAEETGAGRGEGFTINIPLARRSTIAEYRYAFERVIMPALQRFQPGLILISAGQDILSDDPVGNMDLAPPDIGLLAGTLRLNGDAPIALVLEGGYGPSHPLAVRSIFDALDGKMPSQAALSPNETMKYRIDRIARLHRLA